MNHLALVWGDPEAVRALSANGKHYTVSGLGIGEGNYSLSDGSVKQDDADLQAQEAAPWRRPAARSPSNHAWWMIPTYHGR